MRMTSPLILAALLGTVIGAVPVLAQEKKSTPATSPTPSSQPTAAEMLGKMAELAKPGSQHRLLADLVGTWTYKVKFWAAPNSAPTDAGSGTAIRRSLMGGRFFQMEVAGRFLMPGPDGKMADNEFAGLAIDGYDNVKQKFISVWMDSFGTSILLSEGTYDASKRSLTYTYEMEVIPGTKVNAREVLTMEDKDHYRMEWFEPRGGAEVKTMEIGYTREK